MAPASPARIVFEGGARPGRRFSRSPARFSAPCHEPVGADGYHAGVTQEQDLDLWRELGQQLRVDSIRASSAAGSGHPTSSMSGADLMAVLLAGHLRYDFDSPDDPRNDHLIFSKGHASPLLYAMYLAAGAIDEAELLSFRKRGSRIEGHPTPVAAVGRRGDRVARAGSPDRRRRGPRREAARQAPVSGLGPVRRQRDGRGIDVRGVGARGPCRPGQPDGHRRREPPGPDRRDDARLGSRRVPAPRPGRRLARHRDRGP